MLRELESLGVNTLALDEDKSGTSSVDGVLSGKSILFTGSLSTLTRENAEKTSAVHFLRFELTGSMVAALKAGASLSVGIDHPHYRHDLSPVPTPTREALCADLD